MRRYKIFMGIALVLGMCVSADAQDDAMEVRVQELLEDLGISGVEGYSRLVALGPEAVPALCELLETYKFPAVIIDVLSDIQDTRAVPALIRFLSQDEGRTVKMLTVRALKELGDIRAEEALLSIAHDESTHISLKFEATAALARLGSPEIKKQAQEEITEIYRTGEGVADNAHPVRDVIMSYDFYVGLCEVQSDEIDEALAAYITGGARYGERGNVMGLLARRDNTRDRPRIIEALLHVAENEYKMDVQGYELGLQAFAFSILLSLEAISPEKLLAAAETWDDAIASGFASFGPDSEFITEYAQDLRELKKDLLEKYPHLREGQEVQ